MVILTPPVIAQYLSADRLFKLHNISAQSGLLDIDCPCGAVKTPMIRCRDCIPKLADINARETPKGIQHRRMESFGCIILWSS